MELADFFREHPRLALAFSGGTDSAYLLWAAVNAEADITPYFIKTAFQPAFEQSDAQRLAAELNRPLRVVEVDILHCPTVADNPPQRCYHCKRALFSALRAAAEKDGYATVIDGTNASDDADDRPGMRAIRELGVLSPLRLCGITKEEVRRRSRLAGLFTADKPAYACLATRIPTGMPITAENLRQVEGAESALFALGFSNFRVRLFHGAAMLQLPKEQFGKATDLHSQIREALSPYFTEVLLDLKER